MKKILLLTMLFGMIGQLSAKKDFTLTSFAPYDANGSWNSETLTFTASVDWCGGQIWGETDLSSYNRLVVKVTSAAAPFQINLESYTTNDKNDHTTVTQDIPASNDAQTFIISLDENKARFYKFELKLNSTLESAGGAASYAIVISDAYLLAENEYDPETLWSNNQQGQETGDWANNVVLSYSDKGALADIRMNDKIRITYSNAGEDPKVRVANPDGWEKFEDASEAAATTGDDQTFDYEITSAAILEKIQQNGILVRGKNITITKVELMKAENRYDAVPLTIGTDGIATFSSSKHLDFSDISEVKPYYASDVASGTVTLASVTTTSAYVGYIVKGTAGSYNIPVTATGPDWIDAFNYLRPSGDYTKIVYRSAYSDYSGTDADADKIKTYYRYIFAKKDSGAPAFYKLATDYNRTTTEKEGDIESGTTVYYHVLAAHKAYLETTTDITPESSNDAPRRITLVFDNGTTAVLPIENDFVGQQNLREDGVYYTLQGNRVQNPSKGLYILNGKKVLVK
ncbi:MAG: hypothetical protein II404_05050 [Prevotella sp.]|nr:hypothetical protein [Prevotella sp.]